MRKAKVLSILLVVGLLAVAVIADAQQPKKVPLIGYISGGGDASNPGSSIVAFRQGLRDFGYIEGKNILVEFRSTEGKLDRIPGFVAELVQRNVDVLIATNFRAIRAAKETTKSIPLSS